MSIVAALVLLSVGGSFGFLSAAMFFAAKHSDASTERALAPFNHDPRQMRRK